MNNYSLKTAFSLVEAMIILLLISVTIMVTIPLISQKTSNSGIQTVINKDNGNRFIFFGNKVSQRLGFGIDPSTVVDNPQSKVYAGSFGLNYSNANKSINLGRNLAAGAYNNRAAVANEITIGQNSCTGSTIAIGSQGAANTACGGNVSTHIGQVNGTAFISTNMNNSLLVYLNNQPVIQMSDGNNVHGNDFIISMPMAGGADPDPVFNYHHALGATQTLIPGKNISVNGGAGTVTLTRDSYNADTQWTADTEDDENKCTATQVCSRSDPDTCANTYCARAQTQGGLSLLNYSDKRLKNIVSKYTKGIDSIKKIDTFNFTYKSDKKKMLHTGLIAQNLVGVFDEALHKDNKGFYSYERTPLKFAMINSVKSIYNKISAILDEQNKLNSRADKLLNHYASK